MNFEQPSNNNQGMVEGFVITNLGGNIEFVNDVFEEMTQFSKQELLNKSILEFIPDNYLGDRWKLIVDTMFTQGAFEIESLDMQTKNGDTINVKLSLSIMVKPSNKENWVVLYFSNNKNLDYPEELEKKYREIKAKNDELLKQADSLIELSELKSKFLAIASHELKTPLTSIKGYSEILLESMADALSPQVLKMVTRISQAADRLHNVINDMLDVSRIEQNKLQLKPSYFDLKEVVYSVVDELYHFFTKRNITPVILIDDNLPKFYGDMVRIHQVVTNLVSNAIKYSPDTTTTTIKLFVEQDKFHLIVKDEGLGIADSEKKKIFEPFYEISNTSNHSTSGSKFMGGGTGLGLSIVKGIIESHSGKIWVESGGPNMPVELRGSEFHILLPIKAEQLLDENTSESNDTITQTITPTRQVYLEQSLERKVKKTIVIVDNDEESLDLCNVILGQEYDIIGVDCGEVAMKKALSSDKPALVMVNYYLPGLDGVQICRILKALPESKDIPLLFFTAATQEKELEQFNKCGAQGFITKPFSSGELLAKVKEFVN